MKTMIFLTLTYNFCFVVGNGATTLILLNQFLNNNISATVSLNVHQHCDWT